MTVHAQHHHPHHAAHSHHAAQAAHQVATPKYTIRGIDVSHHNHNIDWTKVKGAGYTFGLVRATNGITVDSKFTRNWPAVKAAGLIRGAWHFARVKLNNAVDQAQFFHQTVQPQSGDVYLTLDLEKDQNEGVSTARLRDFAQDFLAEIQRLTGHPAIFYSFGPFIKEKQYMNDPATNWGCPLWLAAYVSEARLRKYMPRAWTNWTFWQWAAMKPTPGTPAGAEQDYFSGSLTDLQKLTYP